MKLENQVCSLELAKKLKELGVKQESLFAYWETDNNKICILEGNFGKYGIKAVVGGDFGCFVDEDKYISAFTVAELGEMLPNWCYSNKGVGGGWDCWYGDENCPLDEMGNCFSGNTESNARAKMLIYLLENKLIKL